MKDGHINDAYEALNFLKVEGHILSLQVQRIVLYLKVKQPESDSQFATQQPQEWPFWQVIKTPHLSFLICKMRPVVRAIGQWNVK